MPSRRLFALAVVSSLAGCAAFAPSSIEVSRDQLSSALARRFPYTTRWLGVFDVGVAMPRLELQPQSNRIGARIDLTANDTLSARRYTGDLELESGLRFEPLDNTLRMNDVRVGRVAIAGLPFALEPQAQRLAARIAEQVLEGAVLHTLDERSAARLRRSGVTPGDIRVTDEGLTIALRPIP